MRTINLNCRDMGPKQIAEQIIHELFQLMDGNHINVHQTINFAYDFSSIVTYIDSGIDKFFWTYDGVCSATNCRFSYSDKTPQSTNVDFQVTYDYDDQVDHITMTIL